MLVRSIFTSFLILAASFPAAAQVDARAIATDVHVGRFDPIGTPLPIGSDALSITLDPFEAVALSWRSAPSLAADPAVRVRVSEDRSTWSEWRRLTIDGDVTNRLEGHYATGIAHFGAPKRTLQISFDHGVDGLVVTAFPQAPVQKSRRASVNGFKIGAVEIRSRTDWGCPDGETSSHGTPLYTTVTHAVLHHTAGENSVPDWDAEMRSIWHLHVFTNGWADIGYNFLIDPNGVVYEGRAGGDGVVGAHFSCRNGNTVGIALLGTYSTVKPTDAAIASLKALLAEICAKDGIDPTAVALHASTGAMLPTILAHRDGNSLYPEVTCTVTECPGDAFYAMIPGIREDVLSIDEQPRSIMIAPGGSATLSVLAKGAGPLSYQWYQGTPGNVDSPISGATSATVIVAPEKTTSYWVRVSNDFGFIDSAASIVNVWRKTRAVRR